MPIYECVMILVGIVPLLLIYWIVDTQIVEIFFLVVDVLFNAVNVMLMISHAKIGTVRDFLVITLGNVSRYLPTNDRYILISQFPSAITPTFPDKLFALFFNIHDIQY